MKTFQDKNGKSWSIELTHDSIMRAKKTAGVDLYKLLDTPDVPDGDETKPAPPPQISRLATDLEALINVVFALVSSQAAAAQISDEQFGEALGGGAILAARDAFWAELADFYRSLHDEPTVKAIETQTALQTGMMRRMKANLDLLDVEATIDAASKKAFTGLPASLVFNPAP